MKLKRCIIDAQPKRIIALLLVVVGAISAYYMQDFIIFTVFVFGVEWGIIAIAVNARKEETKYGT